MTTQRTFKRRIRRRMAKTGESYTAARRVLLAPPAYEPPVSEQALVTATGHGWEHWTRLIDTWDGTALTHTEIARRLREQGVAGWWAQSITLGYERLRGLRAPGQHAAGFTANASRTVAVPVEALWAAWAEDAERSGALRLRTATAPRSARYDWEDGASRVIVGFERRGEAKSVVAVSHERLADADAAAAMKAHWRERLAALKARAER